MMRCGAEFRIAYGLVLGITETHFTVGNDEGLFLGFKGICACFIDR